MTSSRASTWTRLALLAAAAVGLQACAPTGYYSEPDAYYAPDADYYGNSYGDYDDYWYYPAVGAYYDPRVSLYFYYEHDHWIHARELPAHYRPYIGRHVVVRSPHDRPYAEHYRHRERYAPDRYRNVRYTRPDRRDEVWIGAPRRDGPERDRHDDHRGNDRNDNGKYQSREHERERLKTHVRPRGQEPARVLPREPHRQTDARNGTERERRIAAPEPRNRERKLMAGEAPRVRTQDMPRPAREQRGPSTEAPPVRQQTQAPPRMNDKKAIQQGKRTDGEHRTNARKHGAGDSQQDSRDTDARDGNDQ